MIRVLIILTLIVTCVLIGICVSNLGLHGLIGMLISGVLSLLLSVVILQRDGGPNAPD